MHAEGVMSKKEGIFTNAAVAAGEEEKSGMDEQTVPQGGNQMSSMLLFNLLFASTRSGCATIEGIIIKAKESLLSWTKENLSIEGTSHVSI